MLKIYGSPHCPDCVKCKAELEAAGVAFVYMDITGNLMFLKKFLKLRESADFDAVRKRARSAFPVSSGRTTP